MNLKKLTKTLLTLLIIFCSVSFTEKGNDNIIKVKASQISTQTTKYTITEGIRQSPYMMIDEYDNGELNLDTGWMIDKWSRATSPFHIYIDLEGIYAVEKIFLYGPTKLNLRVFGIRDIGFNKKLITEVKGGYKEKIEVDCKGQHLRYIVLIFDTYVFGLEDKDVKIGEEFIPNREFGHTIEPINGLRIFGEKVKEVEVINNIERTQRSFDQFFNTNGHIYQEGRVHSMCSGENVRLFQPFTQYAAFKTLYGSELEPYTTLDEMEFRLDSNAWIADNNATGKHTIEHLRDSYQAVGLKPWISNSGTFIYCRLLDDKGKHAVKENREVDDYWIEGRWIPKPTKGVRGYEKYWSVTKDPSHYGTMKKLSHNLSSVYGKNISTGNDLLWGLEFGNEDDADWDGWFGYTDPEEFAARQIAVYEGTQNRLKIITAGLAYPNLNYLLRMFLFWTRKNGREAKLPLDVFSVHLYSNSVGTNQGKSGDKNQYAITYEDSFRGYKGEEFIKIFDFRDKYMPHVEVDMGEWGFGESGKRGTKSTNQCYSQAGRIIGGWQIPDRHRSDVKGAWIVRGAMAMLKMGFDMAHYYSTECELNYFDTGEYGQGAGFEMFHWNDIPQGEPGSKVKYIEQYEVKYARPSFSTLGLFGNFLTNGGYPITRAYWWVATFRNRLTGYYYIDTVVDETDEKVQICRFRNEDSSKYAYVVYYDDSKNTGVPDVQIDIPAGFSKVTAIDVYVPELPDPRDVPKALGKDRNRTGLLTSSKDFNGQVILPTKEENPYFPIVGPVGVDIAANQYKEKDEIKWNNRLSWRQVDALCDYIEYHPEGIRGSYGDESKVHIRKQQIKVSVTEFPRLYIIE